MTSSTDTPSGARYRLAGILLAVAAAAGSMFGASAASAAKSTYKTSSTTSSMAAATPSPESLAAAKISVDLQLVIAASVTPSYSSWVRDIDASRYVKVIVVATPSADPELASLRQSVLAVGGSVYFRYTSVSALSVLLPAARVIDIAMRADVQGVSPNRMTARTATSLATSALEDATGVNGVRTRTGKGTGYSGLDGSGVGIAILDSG